MAWRLQLLQLLLEVEDLIFNASNASTARGFTSHLGLRHFSDIKGQSCGMAGAMVFGLPSQLRMAMFPAKGEAVKQPSSCGWSSYSC